MGGTEVSIKSMAEALAKHHEVIILTSCPFTGLTSLRGQQEKRGPIKIIRFFPINLYYSFYSQNKPFFVKGLWHLINTWNIHSYIVVRDILKKERPDIIHSHNVRGLSFSVISSINSAGIPHIHTLHDYELISLHNNINKSNTRFNLFRYIYIKVMRNIVKNIKIVTAETQFVLDLLSKYDLINGKAKQYVIPPGFSIRNPEINNKNTSNKNLLYVGKLDKSKGLITLLKAFADMPDKDIRLNIVGRGQLENEVIGAIKKDKRIVYHGFLPQEDKLYRLYSEASLLILPSVWLEPFGLVSLEAFSFGVPVVASNIGGIPEVVQDGYNGFLFRPGDAEDLTNTLKKAMSDNNRLKQLGENAQKSIEKYNVETHVARLLQVYEQAIQ